jgi:tRNA/rRNA methyltransferase
LLSEAELDRLRVVLVATRNPLNVGAAARAMSNFGVRRLRVVNPYEAAFREARSAVGAAAVLADAEECETVAEAVADCALVVGTTAAERRQLQQPLRRLEQGARAIRKQLASGNVALLVGSEKRGLSNEDLSHCHWLLRIPTRAAHGSMNLGQAVAVCLYELVRDPTSARDGQMWGTKRDPTSAKSGQMWGTKRDPTSAKGGQMWGTKAERATAGEMERITTVLLEVLSESGYLKPRAAAATREKIRRLVRRLELSPGDAEVWLGMLRQILWKLRSG